MADRSGRIATNHRWGVSSCRHGGEASTAEIARPSEMTGKALPNQCQRLLTVEPACPERWRIPPARKWSDGISTVGGDRNKNTSVILRFSNLCRNRHAGLLHDDEGATYVGDALLFSLIFRSLLIYVAHRKGVLSPVSTTATVEHTCPEQVGKSHTSHSTSFRRPHVPQSLAVNLSHQ